MRNKKIIPGLLLLILSASCLVGAFSILKAPLPGQSQAEKQAGMAEETTAFPAQGTRDTWEEDEYWERAEQNTGHDTWDGEREEAGRPDGEGTAGADPPKEVKTGDASGKAPFYMLWTLLSFTSFVLRIRK